MNRPRHGMTYVEIAIGVLIIGLVVGPIFSLLISSGEGTTLTRDEVLAYQAASDVQAYARGLDFNDPFLAPGERDCTTLPGEDPAVKNGLKYKRTITVTEHSVMGVPYRYKLIDVNVSWQTGAHPQSVRIPGLLFTGRQS